jgi:hypothetical protein
MKSLAFSKNLGFCSSFPAGNMVISTYFQFAPFNAIGHVFVEVTKSTQDGEVVDRMDFPFLSDGDQGFLNGSNPAFTNARDEAYQFSKTERNLWRNVAEYNNLSVTEIEHLRNIGDVFWDDEHIRQPRKLHVN